MTSELECWYKITKSILTLVLFTGRLWIHAAAHEPTDEEKKSLQDFYRVHYKSKDTQVLQPQFSFGFFNGGF